jgi:two-component system OmpR family response regulator
MAASLFECSSQLLKRRVTAQMCSRAYSGTVTDPGVAVVIEDDQDVGNLLIGILNQAGYEVHSASDGRAGVELVRQFQPAVVTLDVNLPGIDGFEVLSQVRALTDCYVVMLSARDEEIDTLTALQLGADDFLTKPFRPRELRARIAAMMRRPRGGSRTAGEHVRETAPPTHPAAGGGEFRHNGLVLNPETRTASVNGSPLALTRSEFDLLHDLLKAAGAVRTKADLVRVTRGQFHEGGYISDADERAIEVHLGNVRRKLGENPERPRWLLTVRGVGYRLAPVQPD